MNSRLSLISTTNHDTSKGSSKLTYEQPRQISSNFIPKRDDKTLNEQFKKTDMGPQNHHHDDEDEWEIDYHMNVGAESNPFAKKNMNQQAPLAYSEISSKPSIGNDSRYAASFEKIEDSSRKSDISSNYANASPGVDKVTLSDHSDGKYDQSIGEDSQKKTTKADYSTLGDDATNNNATIGNKSLQGLRPMNQFNISNKFVKAPYAISSLDKTKETFTQDNLQGPLISHYNPVSNVASVRPISKVLANLNTKSGTTLPSNLANANKSSQPLTKIQDKNSSLTSETISTIKIAQSSNPQAQFTVTDAKPINSPSQNGPETIFNPSNISTVSQKSYNITPFMISTSQAASREAFMIQNTNNNSTTRFENELPSKEKLLESSYATDDKKHYTIANDTNQAIESLEKSINLRPQGPLVSFNNFSGLLSHELREGANICIENWLDCFISQDFASYRDYPGPLRADKKGQNNRDIIIQQLKNFLKEKSHNCNEGNILGKLSLVLLCSFLNYKKVNIFDAELENELEPIILALEEYIKYQLVLEDHFKVKYFEELELLNNPLDINALPSINDETLLLLSLFLKNQHSFLDSKNSKILVNYVNSKYRIGSPIHILTLIKLGYGCDIIHDNELFDEDHPEKFVLPLFVCIKFHKLINPAMITDFLVDLASYSGEKHTLKYNFLSLICMMLADYQDLQIISDLLEHTNNLEFIQLMESYVFIAKIAKTQFDKNNLILSSLFPSLLFYARSLIDFGLFRNSLNYTDYIIDHRGSFFQLSKNKIFINTIMDLQELANKFLQFQQEKKKAIMSYNEKPVKKQQEEKNIKGGFGLFNFVTNAIEKFVTLDENTRANINTKQETKTSNCYYDHNLKQWIIDGKPPEDEPEIQNSEQEQELPPPVMGIMMKKANNEAQHELTKPDIQQSIEQQQIMPNTTTSIANTQILKLDPFSNPGLPMLPKDRGSTDSNNNARKKLQNRYISNFNN